MEKALAGLAVGLVPANGKPDLLIHYHAHISQRLDVGAADRQFGYCTGDACSGNVFEYELGIDLVDPATNRVVWRGWADGTLDGAIDNQRWMEQRIDEAVAKILARLPPRP